MKLFMEISEVYLPERLHSRVDNADIGSVAPHMAYWFLAKYAEESVRSVVRRLGEGETFLTFIPPNHQFIFTQLAQLFPVDEVRIFSHSLLQFEIEKDVDYFRIRNLVETLWCQSGLTPEEGSKKTKVSLFMNEIGSGFICIEV